MSIKALSPSDHILKEVERQELLICELPSEISNVLIKEEPITLLVAEKLEQAFGLKKELWLRYQEEYENTKFRFWSVNINGKRNVIAGKNLSSEDVTKSLLSEVINDNPRIFHIGVAVELTRRQYINLLRNNLKFGVMS